MKQGHKFLDNSIIIDIIAMSKEDKILKKMEESPKNVRFSELCKVCETPWADDPRINIQEDKGMAQVYQVKQVLAAVKRLEDENESEK